MSNKSTPEEQRRLARDYAHWVAPEMIAMLRKALIFIREHPEMFPDNEEQKTVDTINELEEMLAEDDV